MLCSRCLQENNKQVNTSRKSVEFILHQILTQNTIQRHPPTHNNQNQDWRKGGGRPNLPLIQQRRENIANKLSSLNTSLHLLVLLVQDLSSWCLLHTFWCEWWSILCSSSPGSTSSGSTTNSALIVSSSLFCFGPQRPMRFKNYKHRGFGKMRALSWWLITGPSYKFTHWNKLWSFRTPTWSLG